MRALRSDLRARVRMVHGRKSDFFTNRSCGIWVGVPRTSAYVAPSQVEVLVGCGTSAATLPVERVESWNGSRKCPALGAAGSPRGGERGLRNWGVSSLGLTRVLCVYSAPKTARNVPTRPPPAPWEP